MTTFEAAAKTMWFVVFGLSIASQLLTTTTAATPQVPCFYIFGDSLSDPGNNNFLNTYAKANYPPYGIDFPGGKATGRFCNGRVIVDVLAELLGFDKYIPPYSTKIGRNRSILQGTNYASGAAGLRDDSGVAQGERYAMSKQLALHKNSTARVATALRSVPAASEHLNKCLYYVSIGSNDYINNYFMPETYNSSKQYSPEEFAADLLGRYSSHMKVLYKYGARKVALVGLGQIGFSPYEVSRFGQNAERLNDQVEIFNGKLRGLVDELNNDLSGATFTFINMTAIISAAPPPSDSQVVTAPCCKIGKLNNMTCEPFDKNNVCGDRNNYSFFDNIHLSEAVNVLLGNAYYSAPPPAVYPYNIRDLVNLPEI